MPAELLEAEPAATAAPAAEGRKVSKVETEVETEDVLAKTKATRVVTRRARVTTAASERSRGSAAPGGHPQQVEQVAAGPERLAMAGLAAPRWNHHAAHVHGVVIGSAMTSPGAGLHQLIRQGNEQLRARMDDLTLSRVWKGMETVKREMEEAAGQIGTNRVVLLGTAAGVVATASAGYLVWSAWSGSLMSSVLAMIPVWRGFDPLPVLDRWEKTRRKGKKGTSSRKEPDADETDRKVDRLMG